MKPLRRNFCIVLFICNANILIGAWRARMLFWLFKMAQIWNRHSGNLFSRFLTLETCTGRPRTHRTANDSPSSTQYDVCALPVNCDPRFVEYRLTLWSQLLAWSIYLIAPDRYIDGERWSSFPQGRAWRVKNFVKTDHQVAVRRALAMATQWKNS